MKPLFSEAIKLQDGVFYNLPYHQARTDRTSTVFGGIPIDLTGVVSAIPEHARQGLFKCRVVYGCEGVEQVEFIPYSFRRIETVGLVTDDDIEYGYKYTDRSRLNALLEQSGCDDMIIIRNGYVTDSFAANLVFESNGELFTPDTCLLPGTKRQALLDRGIIQTRTITAKDIPAYDRILFINAMVDLEQELAIDPGKLHDLRKRG